jgi:mono/diheme cytochrome c family protein
MSKFTLKLGESMRTVLAVTLVTIATLLHSFLYPTPPYSTEKNVQDVRAGEEIFVQKCFQCHSVLEGQVRFGPSLYGEMKRPHPKKTAAEIRTILMNGKGKMPPFHDALTQDDTDRLLAYIESL